MSEYYFSVPVLALCTAGFFAALQFFQKEKFGAALCFIIVSGIIMRLYASSDFYLHEWDEKFHALVAKHFLKHPFQPTLFDYPLLKYDFRNWTANHVWLSKPPVPMWLMALSLYAFGISEVAVRIPSLLLSAAAVFLTYQIGRSLFDEKVALMAAFLHAINGILIEVAAGKISSDHVETCFIFFVELAIWLGILCIKGKRHSFLYATVCGVVTGLAFLSKYLPAGVVFPVMLAFMAFTNKGEQQMGFRHAAACICAFLITALSWTIYCVCQFPNEGKEMLQSLIAPVHHVVQQHAEPFWFYLSNIEMVFGELVFLPLLLAIFFFKDKSRRAAIAMLLTWVFLPFVIFSISETKRYTYMLISAPAFFILIAYSFWWLIAYRKSMDTLNWLIGMAVFLLIALPVRYSLERLKPFEQKLRNPEWVVSLRHLNDRHFRKTVIFNCDHYIEAMFYSDVVAYPYKPDQKEIDKLKTEGYVVLEGSSKFH